MLYLVFRFPLQDKRLHYLLGYFELFYIYMFITYICSTIVKELIANIYALHHCLYRIENVYVMMLNFLQLHQHGRDARHAGK